MREAVPGRLWLGTALDARDLRRLYDLHVAAVVDLALEEPPAQLGREIVYCRLPLLDGAGNSKWMLSAAIEVVARLLHESVPTLVACSGGMSRSPAIVAAVLARERGISADDCLLQLVVGQPHDVSPSLWHEIKKALGS